MRIVFVLAHADTSGGVRTVATYARLLGARGHDVTVVSTPLAAPRLRKKVKSLLLGRGWPSAPPPTPTHADDPGIRHHRIETCRPVADRDVPDADVVIATWWETAEWVAALSPRKGVKVHFVQGEESDLPGQPPERVRATWRLPLHRIVCSGWLLGLARDLFGVEDAVEVPNGVDVARFTAPPRERQAVPTVGFVYSDASIKGSDVAAAAIALARRERPELRVVAFGSTPPSAAVPLPPGTEYAVRPAQERIPALYAACDAWLWPSRREGFGLPILEAMACRTPVIAAPAGAAVELLSSGGGILVPQEAPEAMSRALLELLALPPAEWRRLSHEARTVAEGHRWEESARRFERALEDAYRRGPATVSAGDAPPPAEAANVV